MAPRSDKPSFGQCQKTRPVPHRTSQFNLNFEYNNSSGRLNGEEGFSGTLASAAVRTTVPPSDNDLPPEQSTIKLHAHVAIVEGTMRAEFRDKRTWNLDCVS